LSVATGLRVGFIINPFAGVGGPAGLKGSDDDDTRNAAWLGELDLRAGTRASQFLSALGASTESLSFVTVPGSMGADTLGRVLTSGYDLIPFEPAIPSSAEDTKSACKMLLDENVDVIVFVGGDGTARDICAVISSQTSLGSRWAPVLGVPSGVKMHSGVFAITPDAAAAVIKDIIDGRIVSFSSREVRDIDEVAFAKGQVKSTYFGELHVPEALYYIQSVKHSGVEQEVLVLADIAAEIAERVEDIEDDDELMLIFAPGSTTQFIQHELGCDGTLLGVDVYQKGELIARDVNANTLYSLVQAFSGVVRIILTPIGGQGHIIGRGNQQLSPQLLKHLGREALWVVACKAKLSELQAPSLIVDSGDSELDQLWQGLVPVITGYHDQVLFAINTMPVLEPSV